MPATSRVRWIASFFAAFICVAANAQGSRIGLVVGEPFGNFGTMMPQGHAGIYLADFCADSPTHLVPCAPGEPGVVLSRYHDLRHPALDWLAIPLLPFLYGVDDPGKLPASITPVYEQQLREQYRQAHLLSAVPDTPGRHGDPQPPPYGDWEEGIGSAFDRRVLLYTFATTAETEARLAAQLNDTPNHRRYTLGRENCADFVAELLATALPAGTLRRNVFADFDMTTPKNLARELDSNGRAHPELDLRVFAIPQLPGSLRRSRPLRGAAEGFVAEKRYILALTVLQPEALVACWWAYERRGKWSAGADATPLAPTEVARFLKPGPEFRREPVPELKSPLAPAPPAPESTPTESASAQSKAN